MPKSAWTGYERFCPLARALDVVGDRWTLVIVQELIKRASRYGELARRLPGISTTVLADRLRKLESAGLVERQLTAGGSGIAYAVTEHGLGLGEALEALRRWGVTYLTDPSADGADRHSYDVHYVNGIDALDEGEFGLVVDGRPSALRFRNGHLTHTVGEPTDPVLIVRTTSKFMDQWAAGTSSWDDGLDSGDVVLIGPPDRWSDWLAATGYLLAYPPPEDLVRSA
jgi:DNA-binding HxlR family transcriptional regulator